ncbi:MAG: phenylalanine--tRNA ligase subunit beta [Omnitrophica bacterium]|nr:phenylalanine--tRNA ligase subunit beta [Candidatus Omnitrophota bacterium]
MRISFNWLKNYVDIRTSAAVLAEKLTMAGLEVTSSTPMDHDVIMEIEVTPNRTDCLSVVGIAREAAAACGKKLKEPKIPVFRGKSQLKISIQIQEKKLCQRYLGRVIKNVQVGPSPDWLVQHLEAMGIRTVNNIVDITNFCLLEFGQPLHAFDLDKLAGPKILIRRAKEGEEIVTIDGVRRTLDKTMLVIADKLQPQAIAGVMGAKISEVSQTTTSILLESAHFAPLNIHNTSRKLGLATHSSYRFERGVDLRGVEPASSRAIELIQRLACPKSKKSKRVLIGKPINKGQKNPQQNKVRLRFAKVNQSLGTEISAAKTKELLSKIKFTFARKSKESIVVNIPSFRQDISREVDLIEEVARLYGYDKIPLKGPQLTPELTDTDELSLSSDETYEIIRQALSSLGLNEIMSYSLISRQALRKLEFPAEKAMAITNPLSYEQEMLRPTLLVGMLNALLTNINHKNTDLKLFELSRIYLRAGETTEEFTNLSIGIAGQKSGSWLQKPSAYSFFDLKGIVQALLDKLGVAGFRFAEGDSPYFIPGRCACVLVEKENYGSFGEVKKEILERFDISWAVYVAEFKLQKLLLHIRQERKFVSLARFPSIERDISLVAPQEILAEQIISLINKIGREQITQVKLFDQYFGEQIPKGFRGLSFSIEYRSNDRTLTAEEVGKLHQQIRQALGEKLKVQVR